MCRSFRRNAKLCESDLPPLAAFAQRPQAAQPVNSTSFALHLAQIELHFICATPAETHLLVCVPMAPSHSAELAETLLQTELLSHAQIAELTERLADLPDDPNELACALVQRNLLTSYQAEQVVA